MCRCRIRHSNPNRCPRASTNHGARVGHWHAGWHPAGRRRNDCRLFVLQLRQANRRRQGDVRQGRAEGVAAAESGNNGCVGGSLVPTLTLGIPGNSVAAALVGAFIIHGMIPGPKLFTVHADKTYPFIYSLFSSQRRVPNRRHQRGILSSAGCADSARADGSGGQRSRHSGVVYDKGGYPELLSHRHENVVLD